MSVLTILFAAKVLLLRVIARQMTVVFNSLPREGAADREVAGRGL